ncbi:hypothetical protein SLNWT_3354 [Streptomyces albus]|uniref:MvdD-like pre-ATP grasp domain-containing protein n=1 Tax=Streptomyces albus (strain ATCC 21838 / DSM 41398 / FERM P-419 / JCM 4703 / NBRC 107858) TaxID=1081613 RepID=A0A0B5EWZ1_STRA4|nr:hypothetical protein SLNWT_3354 [Streptomyces albus]AOU78035.1 hypothetical protein SLNHY_3344 [Streptomyces albus]AYN33789.1 ATP-grasp ribosomal peptide maturase [Streptomyces albus]
MSRETVLVVTRADDATADMVIEELNRRSVPVVRLDPGDFPTGLTVNARLGQDGLQGAARTATRSADLTKVRSVYWRRPRSYLPQHDPGDQAVLWCREEARYGLGGILATLPGAHYVNHPWRNRDAEYKPAQLAAAAACGFSVPPTLLTNDVDEARKFTREQGPVIYKPLRNTDHHDADGRALTVWVEEVDPAELNSAVGLTMHLFQQRVDSVADLRVTAIGDKVFAVRIDGSPGLDWRRHYETLSYALADPPQHLVRSIRNYLDTFGLDFGAFDFGVDRQGRIWWYECNPNGQFAWFPPAITDRIVTAVADQLQHAGAPHAR